MLCCAASLMAQAKPSVAILGDSYSTFKGYVQPDTNAVWYPQSDVKNNDVQDITQLWWYQFICDNGFRLSQNNSFSGATICHTGYDEADYSDRSYVTRLNNLLPADLIFVFGGTNDSWAKSPIGNYQYGGWSNRDLYQFRPAMAYLLDGIQKRYPGTTVYVIINDGLTDEITTSMKTVCDHYQVKYIQLECIDKQWGTPLTERHETDCCAGGKSGVPSIASAMLDATHIKDDAPHNQQ